MAGPPNAPEWMAAARVEPDLVTMVIGDVLDEVAKSNFKGLEGTELVALCAAAYADFNGIDTRPGEDAFDEEDLRTIMALAARVTALGRLTDTGHLDHKMKPEAPGAPDTLAIAACSATLLHDKEGQPYFQLLEYLTHLERADRDARRP
jgi:hypothetical protein